MFRRDLDLCGRFCRFIVDLVLRGNGIGQPTVAQLTNFVTVKESSFGK
jgi:hypothetical protein